MAKLSACVPIVFILVSDPNCGLLNCERMDHEFENRGYGKKIGKLIRTFLHEYNVIHQINNQSFLVPSAISADPLPLEQEQGVFPFSHPPPTCMDDLTSFPSIGPSVLNQTASTNGAMVKVTGLLYRRCGILQVSTVTHVRFPHYVSSLTGAVKWWRSVLCIKHVGMYVHRYMYVL